MWGIPSEKIGQNIHPPESCFFVINYQYWTGPSAFWPFLYCIFAKCTRLACSLSFASLFLYCSNLIFWLVMGRGVADFGQGLSQGPIVAAS